MQVARDPLAFVADGLLPNEVLLALELIARRWLRSREPRETEGAAYRGRREDGPIEVTSWRPEPDEPSSPAPSGGTYGGNPYTFAGHRYPTDPGRLL